MKEACGDRSDNNVDCTLYPGHLSFHKGWHPGGYVTQWGSGGDALTTPALPPKPKTSPIDIDFSWIEALVVRAAPTVSHLKRANFNVTGYVLPKAAVPSYILSKPLRFGGLAVTFDADLSADQMAVVVAV